MVATGRAFIVVLVIGVSVAASLQAAGQEQEATVAGCLQAGANKGEFVLVTDEKQTYQVQGGEGVELAPHVNHRVELTGTIEKSETSALVKATALKMIASSCEA